MRMYACMYACMHACMYACMHVSEGLFMTFNLPWFLSSAAFASLQDHMYECMTGYIVVCMKACMCIYMHKWSDVHKHMYVIYIYNMEAYYTPILQILYIHKYTHADTRQLNGYAFCSSEGAVNAGSKRNNSGYPDIYTNTQKLNAYTRVHACTYVLTI